MQNFYPQLRELDFLNGQERVEFSWLKIYLSFSLFYLASCLQFPVVDPGKALFPKNFETKIQAIRFPTRTKNNLTYFSIYGNEIQKYTTSG